MKIFLIIISVFLFNSILFSQNDTVFFDKDWKETTKPNASFYRTIEASSKSYIVTDWYINNNPQMRAECSSYVPLIKDGKCIFYFENGLKEAEGYYSNDKHTGKWVWWNKDDKDSTVAEYMSNGTKKYLHVSVSKVDKDKNGVYTMVPKMPQFPGGEDKMMQFIKASTKYPKDELNQGIQGRVYVQFIVNSEGEVTDAKILKGSVDAFNQEAIRVVMLMPKWIPGEFDGKNVSVYFNLPFDFKINEANEYKHHTYAPASIKVADSLFMAEKYREAISVYNQEHKKHPKDVNILLHRAQAYVKLFEYTEAGKDYKKAAKIEPENAKIYFQEVAYFLSNHPNLYKDALKKLEKAIKLNPQYFEAYSYRALIKSYLNDFSGAIQDWDESIKIYPHADSYFNRGINKGKLKNYEEAIIDFNKAIELEPSQGNYYYYRGLNKLELGKNEDGCLDFTRAEKLGNTEAQYSIKKKCQ